jgi:hypothetical protein
MESEISKIRDIVRAMSDNAAACELMVTDVMTLNGKAVPHDVGMAIIVDSLLGKGLYPDGFDTVSGGRKYKFKRE